MNLSECKLYHSEQDLNFEIFSDSPCRAKFRERINIPMLETGVDVYAIVPGAGSSWVVIKEIIEEKTTLRFFTRKGEQFLEEEPQELSVTLRNQIYQTLGRSTDKATYHDRSRGQSLAGQGKRIEEVLGTG